MILDIVWFVLGLLLIVGTGIFVAAEFSLVNLDRSDLEARRDRGEKGLGIVIGALRTTSTHLSSAQLGITLTTLLSGFLLEPAISAFIEKPMRAMGLPEDVDAAVGGVLGVAIATLLSMIIGELVPKNFALALPLRIAKLVMPIQVAFTTVFKPFVLILNNSANTLIRAMGIEPKEELSGARTADELSALVRRSAQEGMLEEDRATLLSRTLSFSQHSASDVMTPRPQIEGLDVGDTIDAVIERSRATGFSRFPVFDDDVDDIVGIVHLKQAIGVPEERRSSVPVGAIQRDAMRVPETIGLDYLLEDLREQSYQMAVVVDEYGGTAGIVTLEDLVEEIVGDLVDEHDRSRASIVRGKDSIVFDGLLRPDELADRTRIAVPDDGQYETVGGFVTERLDRIPVVGDEVEIEGGTLRVDRMDGMRIDRIRFTPTRADKAAPSNDEVLRRMRGASA